MCAVAGGALAFKFGKQIIIFATSLIGSYLFARGLTLVINEEYPTEYEVMKALEADEEVNLDWHFWLYFAVWMVGFVGSAYWQFKNQKEDDEKTKEDF